MRQHQPEPVSLRRVVASSQVFCHRQQGKLCSYLLLYEGLSPTDHIDLYFQINIDTSKQDNLVDIAKHQQGAPVAAGAAGAKKSANPAKKRKTRFSILMEKKAPGKSLLDGRGSIAWEKPPASSTMVRGPSFDFQGNLPLLEKKVFKLSNKDSQKRLHCGLFAPSGFKDLNAQ